MNTVNSSTGFTPFQLRLDRNPRIIPPLVLKPTNEQTPAELTIGY
jgi:hypothetical protein